VVKAAIGDSVAVANGAEIGDGCVIEDHVTLQSNSIVKPGVHVGYGAVVRSNAVVTVDVPPLAVVSGQPATLIGYDSPETSLQQSPHRLDLDTSHQERGSLTAIEFGGLLPFPALRCMMIYNVPHGGHRGNHAHLTLDEVLICVAGSCRVLLDDGLGDRAVVALESSEMGLRVPPMVWTAQFGHSPDAVLVVLASAGHDQSDYVHSYKEFEKVASNPAGSR